MNFQQSGRELLTPDEVRLLDNRKAVLLVRGERPILDEKYDMHKHVNVKYTEDGGAPPYDYAKAPLSHEDVTIDTRRLDDYELLSAEEILGGGAVFLIGGMPLKKRNEMLKRQTTNHATAPMPMGRGPKRTLAAYAALVLTMTVGGIPVLAAGDPLSVINNLSTFIFSLIRAIGLILLGFGVVQVGLSLKSHDPSQRANGFLTLAGGVIITFAKEILDLIVG